MTASAPLTIRRTASVRRTARLQQADGLFDVRLPLETERTWHVPVDRIPATWHVGAIVGPSMAGKSTVARELFRDALVPERDPWPWPADRCILDGFPAGMGIKDITGLLCSVGFSSPPDWRKPFAALSTGGQFRVNLARTLAERPQIAVVDEFTSVVDRTVALVGSAAVAKTVRRGGGKFVAVTCHYDVLPALQPDWVMEVLPGQPVSVSDARGLVQPAQWHVDVVRTDRSTWERYFKVHHYLSAELSPRAQCYAAVVNGEPAAFTAALPFPHATRPGWREHRTVCRPDFQGIGLGNRMSEFVASMYVAKGTPYFSTTSHPAMIRHRANSPLWRMIRKPSLQSPHTGKGNVRTGMRQTSSADRLTAGFEYFGPGRRGDARTFGLVA